MVTTDRGPVQSARQSLADARHTLINNLYQFEQATDALRETKRKHGDGTKELADAQSAFDKAQAAFNQARDAEATSVDNLQSELAAWLPDGTTPEDDVGRLPATEPIVLFPVRLETRFDGGVLKVRVFPDEVFLNTHETALTVAEYDAARNYYEKLNDGSQTEAALWRDLIARFGVQRSAYILRQMLPVFGAGGLSQSSSYSLSSSTCGGTLIGGNNEDLFFPQDVQFRSSTWTRPGEGVLPDRWLVVTYHGGQSRVTLGNRIVEPLAMTADPKLRDGDLTQIDGTTYKIDERIRWTIDFDRAVEIGMGIQVQLQGSEGVDGFDRVIVVGVKSSLGWLETSRLLEQLIDAHHYTRGVALLRQGTPTNNTEGHPTPYPPRENAGVDSFVIERQHAPLDRQYSHHCMPERSNGNQLAMALGVPSGVFSNTDRSYLTDTIDARYMNQALWPGTIGYFMQHMMSPIFQPATIQNARRYFSNYVLARGPAPAFRIGATPYGVLPVSALKNWAARSFGDADDSSLVSVESGLLNPLLNLMDVWLDASSKVAKVRATQANPDLDLATVLSSCASSRQFRIRYGYTAQVQWLFFHFFGWDYQEVLDRLDQETQTTFNRIGFPTWRVPIGRTQFYPWQPSFIGDIVAPAADISETAGLPGLNFITGISGASVTNLNQGNVFGKPSTHNLLYTVLRHSTMAEYARVGALAASFNWAEYFIFNVPSLVGTITTIIPVILNVLNQTLRAGASDHLAALNALAAFSSAELERTFSESLDLTSHRLDAWVGAFAYRRLDDMRRAQVADFSRLAPKGDFLGGYGWLENVRPRVHPTETLAGVGVVETQLNNGGFVHAPSMSHAAAVAVLRNGHMSFKASNPSAYGIDLSSQRVRAGRTLFEGVRNGQPIGALLGYQLERGLHEGYPGVQNLEQLRFTLRGLFPLVANKSGEDTGVASEAIAARNVVDGSLLLRAYKAGELKFGSGGLPAVGTGAYTALISELTKLDQSYDAVADLLTAEGVFQLVRGNMDAAVPTINNVVEGNHPPDSIIARSARGGTGLAQRAALVFPSDSLPTLPAGFPATPTPRAAAEPILNAWAGQLIGEQTSGSATEVSFGLSYLDADGAVIPSVGGQQSVRVQLAELGLHPLDLLALAQTVAQQNQGSALDRRVIALALADTSRKPSATVARFQLDYDVQSGRSIVEVFEVLSTAGAVLRASRPLELKDLLSPAEISAALLEPEAEPVGGANAQAFYLRGKAARASLTSVAQSLSDAISSSSGLASALTAAASFLPMSAFPDPTLADAALLDSAQALSKELQKRLAALPAPIPDAQADLDDTPSATLLNHGRLTIQGVFGQDFVALPDVDPPRAAELGLSLAARATLLNGDDDAPDRYLQQIMRSRPRLGRFRKLNLYARMFGFGRPRVDIVQLPYVPGEQWLGLAFTPPVSTPEQVQNFPAEGRSAVFLLSYAASLSSTVAWAGLVLDDFSEVIPHQVEETGIALNFDSPQAQAPQAVLVATPAQTGAFWTFSDLLGSLEQTMDLMKIRAVSQEQLDVAQVLPMTVMPGNESLNFTLSTIFGGLGVLVDAGGFLP
jgi:hypothetical protein